MSQRNLTLLTDLYELTMMQGYFHAENANETVIFDAFFRNNPDGNGFSIAAGLEQVIDYVKNLHFDQGDIDYLRTVGLFTEDFLEYLRNDRLPQRAVNQGHRPDHAGPAGGDRDLKYHQPSKPDCY